MIILDMFIHQFAGFDLGVGFLFIIGIMLLTFVMSIILGIWAFVDIIRRTNWPPGQDKTSWIIILILSAIAGAFTLALIAYYFLVIKRARDNVVVTYTQAPVDPNIQTGDFSNQYADDQNQTNSNERV